MNSDTTLFRMIRTLTNAAIEADHSHGRMAMVVEAVNDASLNGSASINDIATQLGIDQSGASRLITRAIAAGLVERQISAKDGRSRHCSLTPEGQELLTTARKWQRDAFNGLTSTWTEDEKQTFMELMERITSTAKAN